MDYISHMEQFIGQFFTMLSSFKKKQNKLVNFRWVILWRVLGFFGEFWGFLGNLKKMLVAEYQTN
jgi:hypothetical protein